jgi:hypothetical protein
MKRNDIYDSLLKYWNEIKADNEPVHSAGYWLVTIKDAYIRALNQYPCQGILLGCLLEIFYYSVQCMMQHGGVKRGIAPAIERIDRSLYISPTTIFPLIDGERDYQDSLDSSRTDGFQHDTYDYLVMLDTYIRRAYDAWTENSGLWPCLDNVRKIAGIVVHCLEDWNI